MRTHRLRHILLGALLTSVAVFAVACGDTGGTSSGSSSTPAGLAYPPKYQPDPSQNPYSVTQIATGTPGPMTSPGFPAITPTQNVTPAFSAGDMANYAQNHPVPGVMNGPKVTITRQDFLPSAQIGNITGYLTGYPDSTTLGYVEMHGNFLFLAPPPTGSVQVPIAYEVFDAATGNLLSSGGLKQPSSTNPPGNPTPTPGNPTPTPAPGKPTQTPTPPPSNPTPTPPPAQLPTPTPAPVVKLTASPLATKQACNGTAALAAYSLKLTNTGTATVGYSIAITDTDPFGAVWATVDANLGTISPGDSDTRTITPNSGLCKDLQKTASPITYHIVIHYGTGGSMPYTLTATDTISPPIPV